MTEKIEKRKIVPIAAMISAGKSKLLNVILNINFLESKTGIGTKFVNLIRYNPNAKQPTFYHLKVKNENGEYIFYKDSSYETKIGEESIIEENKNINTILAAKPVVEYEEIFYMTEINDAKFIKDKDYLLTHDLCDIPGLSEYQEQNNQQKENQITCLEVEEEKVDFDDKMLRGVKEFGIIYQTDEEEEKEKNISLQEELKQAEIKKSTEDEDELFYNMNIEKENTYLTEIFKIIKDYIDGAIIVLSTENFYFVENFEIIAKLHKVIQKNIDNFLVVLNKLDLSTNPNADIDRCRGLFIKYFPKCKTFNLNMNTFVPLSAIQVQNELLMNESFPHLINYHFYNYMKIIKQERLLNKTSYNKSFIEHLVDIIKKMKGINKKYVEDKVNELNGKENIAEINNQIKEIIKDIKNKFKADEINLGITEEDLDDKEDDFLEDLNSKITIEIDDIKGLEPAFIIKMIYILQKEKQLIPPISEETNKLLNYFKTKKVVLKPQKTILPVAENTTNNTELNNQIINALTLFCDEFKNSRDDNKQIQNLTFEVKKLIEYLKIYDVIFIPFLGASNAGKTTIINGIIGKELLPCDLNECTKRGIIIRYTEENETTIRKANFREEYFFKKPYYYFEADHIIGRGDQQVSETLKGLNYEFNENEEDSFYYIKTRIKLFDDMGLDKSLKEMIYLIDFPGFGTGNVFEKEIYNKVMSICNNFIFVVRNSVIKEKNAKRILDSIFQQAKEQKNKLSSQFIKSCLFILNNDVNQSVTKDDLDKARGDIRNIIKGVDENDINLCFFNAKYYSNYCYNYNYFFNLGNSFQFEYGNYIDIRNRIFTTPGAIDFTLNGTFSDYFLSNLVKKVKQFDVKIDKNQKINENIKEEVNKGFNEIAQYEKIEDPNYKDKVMKILSFCQDNIKELKTLKESNINEFTKSFLSQIEYVNHCMQEELRENMENVISILDLFFGRDFSERKKDLKEVDEFNNKIENIKNAINKLLNDNQNKITSMGKGYKDNVLKSLKDKKSNLEKLLASKNYEEILEEINKEMNNNIGDLNKHIQDYLNLNDGESSKLIKEAQEILDKFMEGKNVISLTKLGFKTYISKKIGNEKKDLGNELYNEIKNSCESLGNILAKKGFKEWFCSLFSNKAYLQNIIDMVVETFAKKIDYVLKLIDTESNNYLSQALTTIEHNVGSATLNFNDEQLKKWKELCSSYEKTREIIMKLKINK